MPLSPSASLEPGVATAVLQRSAVTNAATHDAQKGREGSTEDEEEGGDSPRGCAARLPRSVAETDPTDDMGSSPPPSGGLKLSLLGSYDASKSPRVALFSATRFGGVGAAVSPAESARSSTGKDGETVLSLSDLPVTSTAVRRKGQPSSSSSSSSPSLSPSIDKLLCLPRGRSLRFFTDGDEGQTNDKRRLVQFKGLR